MKTVLKNQILLISMLLAACSSTVKVSTDYDSKAGFSNYKTFSFYQLTDKSPGLSELNQRRIINAVKDELISKGLVEDSNQPDLMVNVTAIVTEKKQVTANNYYGYGGYYRPYRWGPAYGGSTVYNVTDLKEGALVIDMVDSQTNHLVWQGTGNKEIDKGLKKPDVEIPAAVKKILATFPPGSEKK